MLAAYACSFPDFSLMRFGSALGDLVLVRAARRPGSDRLKLSMWSGSLMAQVLSFDFPDFGFL
jgi:hypothetical protein